MTANKNVCQCPIPPGGSAVCEADQLAICRVKDGNLETYCLDPPIPVRATAAFGAKGRARYMNWALAQITGYRRSLSSDMSASDMRILEQGIYHDRETGETIKFRIPDSILKKVSTKPPPTVNQPPIAYG